MSRAGGVQRAIDDPRVRSALTTTNRMLFDRGIRHGMLLESLKQTEVNAVARYLNNEIIPDISKTLERRLARAMRLGGDRGPWTTQYYRDMMDETLGTIRGGMNFTSKRITEQLTKIGYAEADFAGNSLSEALPFEFSARTPSLQTVRAVVRNTPVEGKLIPRWYRELGDSTQAEITRQINLGITSGEPPKKIIRRITGTKRSGYTDGVFGTTKRNAETLVRTQVTHVSNKARELTYEENMDVIKGVQYVATLDARTTDICAGLDGQVFKPTEGPRPPLHMNCRSTTVPITKSWDELGKEFKTDAFKKLKEPRTENQLRASMNGAVPGKTTYNAWLKGQSAEFQNSVLGRRRAQVFRNDRLHLSRFVNYGTFPPRSLSLDELIAYEKAVIAGTKSGGVGGISGRLGTRGKKKVVRKKKKKVTKKVTSERTPPAPAPQTSGKPTSQMTGEELRAEVQRRHGPRIEELNAMEQRRKSLQSRVSDDNSRIYELRDEFRAAYDDSSNATYREYLQIKKMADEERRLVDIQPGRSRDNLLRLRERQRELHSEFSEFTWNAWKTATEEGKQIAARLDQLSELTKSEKALRQSIRQDIHEMLYLDDAARGNPLTSSGVRFKSGERFEANWQESKAWLERVIHRDTADDAARAVKIKRKADGARSSCSMDGTLNMAANASSRTWVHEFVHRIEDFSEAHLASSRAFYNRRVRAAAARGERIESLRAITGANYKASEKAWRDDFIHPYMGKPYEWTNKGLSPRKINPGKDHRPIAPYDRAVVGNEIATMSVEELFADPVRLLLGDGEMFEFAVDFMRSSGKHFSRKYTDDLLRNPSIQGRLLD